MQAPARPAPMPGKTLCVLCQLGFSWPPPARFARWPPRPRHRWRPDKVSTLAALRNRAGWPTHPPPLSLILADIGQPSPATLAKALGVSERTARRWIASDRAPLVARLALWPLTRWGHSAASAHHANAATLAHLQAQNAQQLAAALAEKVSALEDALQTLDPASNGPLFDQRHRQLQPPSTMRRSSGL